MLIFWLIISLMTLIALLVVVVPLLRTVNPKRNTHQQIQLAIYKDKLSLLTQQLHNNEIDEVDYASAHQELQKSLLNEAEEFISPRANLSTRSYSTAGILLILLPSTAIIYYLFTGASHQVAQQLYVEKKSIEVKAEMAKLGGPQNLIDALKARLQQDPTSARGWFLLGRIYLGNRQFTDAATAFAKANEYNPNQPEIMSAYAESLYFSNKNVLNPQANKLLMQVLQLQPNNPNVINLLAVNAYQQHDYQSAINYWEKLLPLYPTDSDNGKTLLNMITQAQQQLTVRKQTAPVSQIKLQVLVKLANNLRDQVTPNETIFIYAQAVNGPPMPLAIVKKQVKDLPITVTLDESMAMLPTMTLADFSEVRIIARVSTSGLAQPSNEDLMGQSQPIKVKQQRHLVSIIIDRTMGQK